MMERNARSADIPHLPIALPPISAELSGLCGA